MAGRFMDPDLAAEIVGEVEARVGRAGSRSVHVSDYGERFHRVFLSRGGIVTPGTSRLARLKSRRENEATARAENNSAVNPSSYHADLAVVSQSIGVHGPKGVAAGEGLVDISPHDSHEHVFVLGEDGLWRAYDAQGQSQANYWTETTQYFLDAARVIEADEEGIAIKGLLTVFDEAVAKLNSAAIATVLAE